MLSDTILKKYSSTVATIFTGIASAALFGHTLTINFILGITVVFISMHQVLLQIEVSIWPFWVCFPSNSASFVFQFFSSLSKVKDEQQNGVMERLDIQNNRYLFVLFVCFVTDSYSTGGLRILP